VKLAGREITLDRQFNDTYHLALGARCRLNDQWTWGFGVAYDTSPVDDEDRTIDMTLDEQWRYATGVEYALNDKHTLGLAYSFVNLGKAEVDQTYPGGAGRVAGEFDTDYLHVVTLTWGMKF
jgi:long-chain fatty acid transport protein